MRDRIVFASYLAMALASCAFFEVPVVDDWHKAREPIPMTSWTRVNNIRTVCRQSSAWNGVACSQINITENTCRVYAVMSEDEARRTWWHDGMLVWDHENKHCDGYDHAATTVRSLTAAQGVVR